MVLYPGGPPEKRPRLELPESPSTLVPPKPSPEAALVLRDPKLAPLSSYTPPKVPFVLIPKSTRSTGAQVIQITSLPVPTTTPRDLHAPRPPNRRVHSRVVLSDSGVTERHDFPSLSSARARNAQESTYPALDLMPRVVTNSLAAPSSTVAAAICYDDVPTARDVNGVILVRFCFKSLLSFTFLLLTPVPETQKVPAVRPLPRAPSQHQGFCHMHSP